MHTTIIILTTFSVQKDLLQSSGNSVKNSVKNNFSFCGGRLEEGVVNKFEPRGVAYLSDQCRGVAYLSDQPRGTM